MSQATKVKKDIIGLYVTAGSYISRPVNPTIFKEGDLVKTHHFGGSPLAGVTLPDKKFTFKTPGDYETWTTTGLSSYDYKEKKIPNIVPDFGQSYSTFEEFLQISFDFIKRRFLKVAPLGILRDAIFHQKVKEAQPD